MLLPSLLSFLLSVLNIFSILFWIYILAAIVIFFISSLLKKQFTKLSKQQLRDKISHPSHGDRVMLVESPFDGLWRRIQLLREAQQTLDISYHCVEKGISTRWFIAEVLAAADRGVKVRFLMDGKVNGMEGSRATLAYALFCHPNIDFKVYNPIYLTSPWKWNSLLHDKFMLVDQTFLLLGSRNLGDAAFDFPEYRGTLSLDRDVLVYNTNLNWKKSVLYQVKEYMDEFWVHPDTKPAFTVLSAGKRAAGEITCDELKDLLEECEKNYPQYCQSYTPEEWVKQTLSTQGICLIHNSISSTRKPPYIGYLVSCFAQNSSQSICIQTPYITAGKETIVFFKELHKKNVACKLSTNSVANSFHPAFANYYMHRSSLCKTGLVIREYQSENSIHAKSFIFDHEISVVGSCNLDNRSIYFDTESVLVIYGKEFAQQVEKSIEVQEEQSSVVGENNQYVPNDKHPSFPVSPMRKIRLKLVGIFSMLFEFLL